MKQPRELVPNKGAIVTNACFMFYMRYFLFFIYIDNENNKVIGSF